jgi:hypothetical protein
MKEEGTVVDNQERRMLKYARVVAESAEQLDARLDHIGKMSRDVAREVHQEMVEAIERFQTFEKLLARRIHAA